MLWENDVNYLSIPVNFMIGFAEERTTKYHSDFHETSHQEAHFSVDDSWYV